MSDSESFKSADGLLPPVPPPQFPLSVRQTDLDATFHADRQRTIDNVDAVLARLHAQRPAPADVEAALPSPVPAPATDDSHSSSSKYYPSTTTSEEDNAAPPPVTTTLTHTTPAARQVRSKRQRNDNDSAPLPYFNDDDSVRQQPTSAASATQTVEVEVERLEDATSVHDPAVCFTKQLSKTR